MDNINTLALTLGDALKHKHYRLALAESCTGGMVAEAITSIAGSSQWFDCGFVSYSNQSKIKMLKVPQTVLDEFGAVSEQAAMAMVQGALLNSHANIAGSITGIAGPDGGTALKPVGLVYMAWASADGLIKRAKFNFVGDRQSIREQACEAMLKGLLNYLNALS